MCCYNAAYFPAGVQHGHLLEEQIRANWTSHPSLPSSKKSSPLPWPTLLSNPCPSHFCNQLDPTTSASFSVSQWFRQPCRQRKTYSQILAVSLFYMQQPLDKIQRKCGVRPRVSRSRSGSHAGHCPTPQAPWMVHTRRLQAEAEAELMFSRPQLQT